MRRLRVLAAILSTLIVLAIAVTAFVWVYRPGMKAYAAHRYVPPSSPGALTATWFGVTAVLLSDGDSSIFIDPFFTRPEGILNLALNREIAPDEGLIGRWLDSANIKRLDAVLVSHSHYDHGMDAGVVAKLTGALLVGSESTANIGRGNGLPDSQLRVVAPGSPIQLGAFTVTFIESKHAGATGGTPTGEITQPLVPPAHYLDYKLGGAYSVLVEHREGAILHHGSAGFVPGALAGRHADVVFLGIAVIDDLDVYLRQVVDSVGATRIMPTHWDDFARSLNEPLTPMPVAVRLDSFFDDVKTLRPQVKVETLELGERVALFSKTGG